MNMATRGMSVLNSSITNLQIRKDFPLLQPSSRNASTPQTFVDKDAPLPFKVDNWDVNGMFVLGSLILVMLVVLIGAVRLVFNDVGRSSRVMRSSSRKSTAMRHEDI